MQVEDEWDRDPEAIDLEDLLFVTYDSGKITVDGLRAVIRKAGFEAEVRQ